MDVKRQKLSATFLHFEIDRETVQHILTKKTS